MQYLGCVDERFNADNFGDCADWLIFQALENYEKNRREDINQRSITNAFGWSGLFNGFAGKGGSKVEASNLLPFQTEKQEKRVMSAATERILKRLIHSRQLPPAVNASAILLNPQLGIE